MSEQSLPPSPTFIGIDFNPSFFPSATPEFVEYPVAQGTVTFSKIFATDIEAPTPTSDFDFLTSQTTGVLNIGTGSRTGAGAINIGTSGTGAFAINVGTAGQSTTALNGTNITVGTKISSTTYDSTGTGTAMTLGGNLDTADVSIGGIQSSGGINIGASLNRTTGGTINIGTRSTSANPINIGSSTSVTSVGNTLAVTGLLTANGGIALPSGDTITGATYNSIDAATSMTLGSNLTTGDLTIAGAQTTGDINIGNGSARLAGGAINIGAGTTAANPITIGGTSSVITLNAQPTIGYAVKVATATSSLAFIGGRYEVRINIGSRTINTSRTAFCVMNALPTGVYHITPYVYIPQGVATNVEVLLCTGTSPISEGNTTGLTPVGDGSETFSSASATIPNSVNSSWVYVVSSPVNIALGISSGIILSSTSAVYLKIIRIG